MQSHRSLLKSARNLRTIVSSQRRSLTITASTMQSQNSAGQGTSHATDQSAVPKGVQNAAPEGLERALPEKVHPTGDGAKGTNVSHAKGGGEESIVPQKIQEMLPESVERAVPNAIHNTGDKGGAHRS